MKKRWLVLLFALAFVATALTQFPIAAVARWVGTQPLSIQALSGTLFAGSARNIQAPNGVHVNEAEWQLQPAQLLQGQLSSQVRLKALGGNARGQVGVGLNQHLHLEDTRVHLPASALQQLIGLPFFQLFGDLSLDLKSAELAPQGPQAIEGVALWQSALIKGTAEADLGHIKADLSTEGELMQAELSNQGGTLRIQGQATLTPQGDYSADLRIAPEPGTHAHVLQALNVFAQKAADGSYQVKQSGNLRDGTP